MPDLTLNLFILDINVHQDDSEDPQDDGKCSAYSSLVVFMAWFCFCECRNSYCVHLAFMVIFSLNPNVLHSTRVVLAATHLLEPVGMRYVRGYPVRSVKHGCGIGSWLTKIRESLAKACAKWRSCDQERIPCDLRDLLARVRGN